MEQLVIALGPVFAVGIALQALFEWLDGPIFEGLVFKWMIRGEVDEKRKKGIKSGIVRTIALIIGVAIAVSLDLEVLRAFGESGGDFGPLGNLLDNFIAGLIISMGTDSINQIVKFVEKAKENQEKP